MPRKSIQIIQRIDFHIKHKSTGSPKHFAEKLAISERSLYDHLLEMKAAGTPIKYDNFRETYYYTCGGSFYFGFVEK